MAVGPLVLVREVVVGVLELGVSDVDHGAVAVVLVLVVDRLLVDDGPVDVGPQGDGFGLPAIELPLGEALAPLLLLALVV